MSLVLEAKEPAQRLCRILATGQDLRKKLDRLRVVLSA